AMARLVHYGWPGNVRELRNLVERMVIMAPGEEITTADLPEPLRRETDDRLGWLAEEELGSLRSARAVFEKRYIERKLEQCGGNVSKTAELLELERSHLYRKLRAYGLLNPRI
ncbi:MAG: sigma-54-dependent Fis family transcriptional regulator, partial [Thermoanaerobaculia bacterium]|nr:sigma-54-dependent Fis family transcriptional regulator [Thermoanaerobaculia bacterium]